MKKGFTLLELIVVISVVLILIGIAIPRIKGMRQSGQLTQARAELQTLQAAVESYHMNTSPQAWPEASGNSGAACVAGSDTMDSNFQTNLLGATPQLLTANLNDPLCSGPYYYQWWFNGNFYVIDSVGTGGDHSYCQISSVGAVTCYNTSSAVCTPGTPGCGICVTNGSGC